MPVHFTVLPRPRLRATVLFILTAVASAGNVVLLLGSMYAGHALLSPIHSLHAIT